MTHLAIQRLTLQYRIWLGDCLCRQSRSETRGDFVVRQNRLRHHQSLDNLTSANIYSKRGQTILPERKRIKRITQRPNICNIAAKRHV
jgi:putative transposase